MLGGDGGARPGDDAEPLLPAGVEGRLARQLLPHEETALEQRREYGHRGDGVLRGRRAALLAEGLRLEISVGGRDEGT